MPTRMDVLNERAKPKSNNPEAAALRAELAGVVPGPDHPRYNDFMRMTEPKYRPRAGKEISPGVQAIMDHYERLGAPIDRDAAEELSSTTGALPYPLTTDQYEQEGRRRFWPTELVPRGRNGGLEELPVADARGLRVARLMHVAGADSWERVAAEVVSNKNDPFFDKELARNGFELHHAEQHPAYRVRVFNTRTGDRGFELNHIIVEETPNNPDASRQFSYRVRDSNGTRLFNHDYLSPRLGSILRHHGDLLDEIAKRQKPSSNPRDYADFIPNRSKKMYGPQSDIEDMHFFPRDPVLRPSTEPRLGTWKRVAAADPEGFPNTYHGNPEFGGNPDFSHTWFHGTKGAPQFGERRGRGDFAEKLGLPPEERMKGSAWPQPNQMMGIHLSPLREVAHKFAWGSQPSAIVHAKLNFDNPAHYPTERHLDYAVADWASKNFPEWHDEKLNRDRAWNYSDNEGTHADFSQIPKGYGNKAQDVLQWHPYLPEIIKGFHQHLADQGHHGITYGNMVEGPYISDMITGGRRRPEGEPYPQADWPSALPKSISAIAQPEDIQITGMEHIAPWDQEPAPGQVTWEQASRLDEPEQVRDRVLDFHRQNGGAYPGRGMQYEAMATDWNEHYDKIPEEIHRGLFAPESHEAFSWPMSDEDIAHSLIRAHQEEHYPRDRDQDEKFGTHWTASEDVAQNFAKEHEREHADDEQCEDHDEHSEARPVVFHAQRPERHEIETDPRRLGWQNVYDFDDPEQEVTIKHGSPVRLTGVSWEVPTSFGSVWNRYDLREPMELRAEDRDSPEDTSQWNGPNPMEHEASSWEHVAAIPADDDKDRWDYDFERLTDGLEPERTQPGEHWTWEDAARAKENAQGTEHEDAANKVYDAFGENDRRARIAEQWGRNNPGRVALFESNGFKFSPESGRVSFKKTDNNGWEHEIHPDAYEAYHGNGMEDGVGWKVGVQPPGEFGGLDFSKGYLSETPGQRRSVVARTGYGPDDDELALQLHGHNLEHSDFVNNGWRPTSNREYTKTDPDGTIHNASPISRMEPVRGYSPIWHDTGRWYSRTTSFANPGDRIGKTTGQEHPNHLDAILTHNNPGGFPHEAASNDGSLAWLGFKPYTPEPVAARVHQPEPIDDHEYSLNEVSRHYPWEGFDKYEIEHLVRNPEHASFTLENVPVDSLRHLDEHGGLVRPPSYDEIASQGEEDEDDGERERLEELERGYRQGANIPPAVVVRDGPHHIIADGSHRAAVYERRGETHMPAFVTERTIFPTRHEAAAKKPKPKKPRKPEEVWYDVHKHPEGVPGGMGRSPEHHLRNRGWSPHEIHGAGSKTIQYMNHQFPDFVISYGGASSTKPDHNFRVLYIGPNRNVPKVTRAYSVAEAMNKVDELHEIHRGHIVVPMTHGAATDMEQPPEMFDPEAEMPQAHRDWLEARDWKPRTEAEDGHETFAPHYTKMTPSGIKHSLFWDGKRAWQRGAPVYQLESSVPDKHTSWRSLAPAGANPVFESSDLGEITGRAKENERAFMLGGHDKPYHPGLMRFMQPDMAEYDQRFWDEPPAEGPVSDWTEFGKFNEPQEKLHPNWRTQQVSPQGRSGMGKLNATGVPHTVNNPPVIKDPRQFLAPNQPKKPPITAPTYPIGPKPVKEFTDQPEPEQTEVQENKPQLNQIPETPGPTQKSQFKWHSSVRPDDIKFGRKSSLLELAEASTWE